MGKNEKKDKSDSMSSVAQAGAANEVVQRYGDASKQHLVAYSGVDNENVDVSGTPKHLKRGLKKIATSKINPEYREQNVKQQAGFAAEEKYTARQNAEKIISGSKERYTRTDDIGRVNDQLHDHVLLDSEGIEILGTGEQMKFIGKNPKACLNGLMTKKFEKYLDANATITVPSDYYDDILAEADIEIDKLLKQIEKLKEKGDLETAERKLRKLSKYKKIKTNLKDSGITNKEAIFARLHPKLSTAIDVTKISHRAGVEQAKTGALVGGGFSLIRNFVAVVKEEKEPQEAAIDLVKDTGKGATIAYATAFAGSTIKAAMQNASNQTIRSLSKTNAPAAIVTSTIDVGKTMKQYITGEITGLECLENLGEKGTGNLSAALFATIGQAVIPIPVIGAMAGSMIGYSLSSTYYKELTNSLKEAKLAHEERLRIEAECAEAISMINQFRAEMNRYVAEYLSSHKAVFNAAFKDMDEALQTGSINQFIQAGNTITRTLGGTPPIETVEECNAWMRNKEESLNI